AQQPRALGAADRVDAVSVAATRTRAAPIAHLDEDDDVAVAHDEVDLAVAAMEIALGQRQAGALQVRQREILEARTGRLRRAAGAEPQDHGIGVALSAPSAGCAMPPAKRAQLTSRWMRPKLSAVSSPVAP